MIVDQFHVPGVTIPELERDAPGPAGRDRPLSATVAAQLVQSDRRETGKVLEPTGLVEQPKPPPRQSNVKAGESALPFLREALRRPVGPGLDHDPSLDRFTLNVKRLARFSWGVMAATLELVDHVADLADSEM